MKGNTARTPLGLCRLTQRNFEIIEFKDFYKVHCSIQQSSIVLDEDRGGREDAMEHPGASALWIGVEPDQYIPANNAFPDSEIITRMHLNLDQVKALISVLQTWVDTGALAK